MILPISLHYIYLLTYLLTYLPQLVKVLLKSERESPVSAVTLWSTTCI